MRFVTWVLVAVAASLLGAASGRAASPRPNILFILSDDHRWDCLGVAGNPQIVTPHLDGLARAGAYFPQATVYVPQCSPSRATLLTGIPPQSHGYYSNQFQRPDTQAEDGLKVPTLPGVLARAGYRTVLIGKWHLAPRPWNLGFTDVRRWMPAGGGPYRGAPLAEGNSSETHEEAGFTQTAFADSAIDFLKSDAAREKPFFLWLGFTAPHHPLGPNPPSARAAYDGKREADLRPPHLPARARPKADVARHYYEAITALDEQVGRTLDAVREAGLEQNTVVVFLGDNGFMMGSRGENGKVVPYEESVRVPLIIRDPRVKESRVCDAPVSSLDLPVTMLRWAGIPAPATWPGRDLAPLVTKGVAAGFDVAFSEWSDDESKEFGKEAYRLVRTAHYKLIRWKNPRRADELYDLETDPHEQKNLAGKPVLADIEDELRGRLAYWLQRNDDPARSWPAPGKALLREPAP